MTSVPMRRRGRCVRAREERRRRDASAAPVPLEMRRGRRRTNSADRRGSPGVWPCRGSVENFAGTHPRRRHPASPARRDHHRPDLRPAMPPTAAEPAAQRSPPDQLARWGSREDRSARPVLLRLPHNSLRRRRPGAAPRHAVLVRVNHSAQLPGPPPTTPAPAPRLALADRLDPAIRRHTPAARGQRPDPTSAPRAGPETSTGPETSRGTAGQTGGPSHTQNPTIKIQSPSDRADRDRRWVEADERHVPASVTGVHPFLAECIGVDDDVVKVPPVLVIEVPAAGNQAQLGIWGVAVHGWVGPLRSA
jgi:hypothetical protein